MTLAAAPTLPAPGALPEALALAAQSIGVSDPNPRVGCVLTDRQGVVIGRGCTQAAGGAHAEVMALRDAAAAGRDTSGATAWVTLEPCSHHGRTGPCCDALIEAGVAKVVATTADPNPLVAGRGFARLRAAGIDVVVLPAHDALALESRALNIGFFSRMQRGRPWLRMKIAASLDGTTALADGSSQWITGDAARADGHAWRQRAGALLTGIGTVLEDDPLLNVRVPAAATTSPRQPPLVVVDSRLQTPLDARLWTVARRAVRIYAAADDRARRAALEARGATVTRLPGANGKVDLAALLADLARREVNELHVEAGHKLNASLLEAGLVDELLVYLAPKLLGPARGMTALSPLSALSDALPLEFRSTRMIGADLRIVAVVAGRDRF